MNLPSILCKKTKVPQRRSNRAGACTRGFIDSIALINNGIRALLRGRDEGQALVEVAVSVSLLMMVLTGIFAFGVAFYNKLMLTQAVGSGAQYLQQIRTSTSDPCSDTFTAIKNAAPNLTPSKIGLTLILDGTSSSTISSTTVTATTCSTYASKMVQSVPATVTATYPCSLSIFGFTSSSSCTLSATVTEYVY
jgi:Flp pilus assembly protein TadG